jgi:hypothetical protein
MSDYTPPTRWPETEQAMTEHLAAKGWPPERAAAAAGHYWTTARRDLATWYGLEDCAVVMYPGGPPAPAARPDGGMPREMATALYQFEPRQSGDLVKTDLELTCRGCGEVLCDIEHGDDFNGLVAMALSHECRRPATGGEVST